VFGDQQEQVLTDPNKQIRQNTGAKPPFQLKRLVTWENLNKGSLQIQNQEFMD
jgi:hypothetical protein